MLIERHRAAGLEVDVRRSGDERPLAPAVEQAAYRIAQESLTNALRHGRGRVALSLTFAPDAVEIVVENPAAAERAGDGHGIAGMRERALLLGGSFDARADDGVFRVRVKLPCGGEATP